MVVVACLAELECDCFRDLICVGVSAKKLESWLDEQDEDLNELREELKKETKQHENTLRVTSSLLLYLRQRCKIL